MSDHLETVDAMEIARLIIEKNDHAVTADLAQAVARELFATNGRLEELRDGIMALADRALTCEALGAERHLVCGEIAALAREEPQATEGDA